MNVFHRCLELRNIGGFTLVNSLPDVVFVMTTYNRKSLTLKCLSDIESQHSGIKVVVVDDNSTDGTPELIEEFFPNVDLIRTGGENFWALGMKIGQDHVFDKYSDSKWIFFINDDVQLYPGVIQKVFEICTLRQNCVLVGSLVSPDEEKITYGGLIKTGVHPLNYVTVRPTNFLTEVDTFHGNFVAIPINCLREVRGIEGRFAHAYADFDLGLRLSKAGTKLLLLPFIVGYCSPNNLHTIPRTFLQQIRFLFSKKGRPLGSQYMYMRRHGPKFFWLIFVLSPYARPILKGVKDAFSLYRWKN